MKPPYQQLIKLLVCCIATAALQGCGTEPGYWRNEKIQNGKRSDLHEMDDKVMKMIKNQDTKALSGMLSRELVDVPSATSAISLISNQMHADSFERSEEFYIVNKYIESDTVNVKLKGDEAHKLIFPGVAQEMYLAFYTPKNNMPNKWMVTAGYAKYDYGWKLGSISSSPYTINGKTAQELYRSAMKEREDKYLINAYNDARMANTCLRPSKMWIYDNEKEITGFFEKLQVEVDARFKLPMVFNMMPTKPGIIGFFNKTTNEGNFPVITYLTRINIKDVEAIKKENLEMRKYIGQFMPGVDIHKKYIYYKAYNKLPSYTVSQPSYEIEQKIQ